MESGQHFTLHHRWCGTETTEKAVTNYENKGVVVPTRSKRSARRSTFFLLQPRPVAPGGHSASRACACSGQRLPVLLGRPRGLSCVLPVSRRRCRVALTRVIVANSENAHNPADPEHRPGAEYLPNLWDLYGHDAEQDAGCGVPQHPDQGGDDAVGLRHGDAVHQ